MESFRTLIIETNGEKISVDIRPNEYLLIKRIIASILKRHSKHVDTTLNVSDIQIMDPFDSRSILNV